MSNAQKSEMAEGFRGNPISAVTEDYENKLVHSEQSSRETFAYKIANMNMDPETVCYMINKSNFRLILESKKPSHAMHED